MSDRRWIWSVLSLAFVVFLRMLGIFLVIPVFSLGTLTEYSGSTKFLAGVALGGYAVTQAISQFPMGWMSDRWGRKIALVIGLLIFSIGGLWAYLTTTIEGLIIARLVQGLGGVSAVVMAAMGDISPPQYRARSYMLSGMAIGGSIFFGIILGGILYGIIGFRKLFLILAILSFVGFLIALMLPLQKRPVSHSTNQNFKLSKIFFFVSPALYVIFALTLLMQIYFFVLPLALTELNIDRAKATALIIIPSAFVYPIIHIAEKRRKIKFAYYLGYLLILLASLLYLLGYDNILPVVAVLGGTTVYLLGYSLFQPLLPSFISFRVGEERRGLAMAMYNFIGYGGMAVGGPLAGFIMQHVPSVIWIVPLVVSLIMFVFVKSLANANY